MTVSNAPTDMPPNGPKGPSTDVSPRRPWTLPGGLPRAVGRAVLRFLGGAVLVLWGAITLAFTVLKLVPGDPVDVMLGPMSSVPPEVRADIRQNLGLDEPVIVQYLQYLGNVLSGDLGQSYQQNRPVIGILAEQAGPTLLLAVCALTLAIAIAVPAALVSRRGFWRGVANLLELIAVSAPVFWTAMLLASIFSYRLQWLPVIGGNELTRLILPAISMALPISGVLAQVLRQGLDRAESAPFTLTVRARGRSRTGVVGAHTLRHAVVGTVTLGGFLFGSLLGGAVLVETVFARPGLGRVTLEAILGRDLPVVMGVVVLSGVVFIVINLFVDLAALAIDPRLRPARGAKA